MAVWSMLNLSKIGSSCRTCIWWNQNTIIQLHF